MALPQTVRELMLPGGKGLIHAIEVSTYPHLPLPCSLPFAPLPCTHTRLSLLPVQLQHIKKGDESNDCQSQIQQHNPKYNHSVEEYKTVQLIQRGIRLHIKGIVDRAKSEAGEVLFERMNEVERKNKEIMKRLHNIRSSISSSTGLFFSLLSTLQLLTTHVLFVVPQGK
jgi:hypothetical protein